MTPHVSAANRGITLRLRRHFSKRRDVVFRAWTTPETLRLWWCPAGWVPTEIEVNLRVGGAYRFGMRRVEGGDPVYVHGRFLEICEPEKLVYTWKWENALDEMQETRVTVTFADAAGATELELTHEALPQITICLLHRAGWLEAWQRLTRIL